MSQIVAKITENVKENCRIFTKIQTSITPCKKQNPKKSPFIPHSRMYVLLNDTTHKSLQ